MQKWGSEWRILIIKDEKPNLSHRDTHRHRDAEENKGREKPNHWPQRTQRRRGKTKAEESDFRCSFASFASFAFLCASASLR